MSFRQLFAAFLLSVIVCTAASAQAPSYRNQGYKGSVGISTFEVFPGIETAHGYMINSNHFIGGGLNVLKWDNYLFFKEFIQYQWYFVNKNNTPLITAQLGLIETNKGNTFLYFEPRFGWSWGIADRFGITLSGGIGILSSEELIPSINLAFEF